MLYYSGQLGLLNVFTLYNKSNYPSCFQASFIIHMLCNNDYCITMTKSTQHSLSSCFCIIIYFSFTLIHTLKIYCFLWPFVFVFFYLLWKLSMWIDGQGEKKIISCFWVWQKEKKILFSWIQDITTVRKTKWQTKRKKQNFISWIIRFQVTLNRNFYSL